MVKQVKDLTLKHELLRKMFHMFAGVCGIALALSLERNFGSSLLAGLILLGLLISLVTDYFRIEHGWKTHVFDFMQRKREIGRLHATTFSLIGVLIAFLMFDRDIGYAAVAMFFFGDAAAAVFGRLWGKTKLFGNKSWVGTGAMLVVSVLVGAAITKSIVLAVVMAVVATFIELVVDEMDDSFLIILFGGVAGQLVRILF